MPLSLLISTVSFDKAVFDIIKVLYNFEPFKTVNIIHSSIRLSTSNGYKGWLNGIKLMRKDNAASVTYIALLL